MPDKYPVVVVDPAWVEPEEMGTKGKFWYRRADDQGPAWLFKYPQRNTGQHWAEKIAAEIAQALDVRHARVELAEFDGKPGSVSESFAPEGTELVHGNQILAWTVESYDRSVRFGQTDHSFDNIWTSFDHVFRERSAAEANRTAFAGYIVLDALITEVVRRVPADWMSDTARAFLVDLIRYNRDQLRELVA